MPIFAELDENKRVKAILNTWKKPDIGMFVELEKFDDSVLGGKYDEKNKTFIPPEPVKPEEDLLTIVKRIESDLAVVKSDVSALKTIKETPIK